MGIRRILLVLALLACLACDRSQSEGTASTTTTAPVAPASVPSAAASAEKPRPRAVAGPRLLSLGFQITRTYAQKRLHWRQVRGLNWQPFLEAPSALPPQPTGDSGACPPGMSRVEGDYLLDRNGRADSDEVELLQNRTCSLWKTNNHGLNGLCERFNAEKWREASAELPRQKLDFCIDRYEFPNSYGEYPLVVATFSESQAYCEKVGKRLCTENEWTFACEGEAGLPYPYGYERDETACRIGVLAPGPGKDTFRPRTTARTARGIDFAWQGKRSGEMSRCKSPFGVYDMTGNVDEWTVNSRKYGYRMIMKGGHWGPARQRCRPQTRGHGPRYVRYDQGFRCCRDAP